MQRTNLKDKGHCQRISRSRSGQNQNWTIVILSTDLTRHWLCLWQFDRFWHFDWFFFDVETKSRFSFSWWTIFSRGTKCFLVDSRGIWDMTLINPVFHLEAANWIIPHLSRMLLWLRSVTKCAQAGVNHFGLLDQYAPGVEIIRTFRAMIGIGKSWLVVQPLFSKNLGNEIFRKKKMTVFVNGLIF